MGSVIGWLIAKGLNEKLARAAAIGGLILLIVGALGATKCAYDRNVIERHEARQDAANSKADRKADNNAAERRGADQARRADEKTEIEETIDEARRTGADPRAAYYECVRRQQAARAERRPPPDC